MKWLSGLVNVRNCLTHRLGIVQLIDVKPAGASIEDTKDTDRLRAVWLRPKFFIDGSEIKLPHTHEGKSPAALSVGFDEYEREWKIGDTIEITPDECQTISFSLSLLGNLLLTDFQHETLALLRASKKLNLPSEGEVKI